MKKKKIIDISTEEKKREVYEKFDSFTSKNQAHEYFGISDNTAGSVYLQEIAEMVGFDFSLYKTRKKKEKAYCLECGEEITSKWGKIFCSPSCAAKYNNKHRDKSIYEKIANKLKKERNSKNQKIRQKNEKKEIKHEPKISEKQCEWCGLVFKTKNSEARFCSGKCASSKQHEEAYNDFLKNPEKYCRGNYTPKAFKKEFMKDQEDRCAICGCGPEHNGKPLVFVLDHIDGDASNNKRENLRMICPNCDSQLPTFKSKNKNSTRRNYWKEHILKHIIE